MDKVHSFTCPYCSGNSNSQIDENHLICDYCGGIFENKNQESATIPKTNDPKKADLNPKLKEVLNEAYFEVEKFEPVFKEIVPQKTTQTITTSVPKDVSESRLEIKSETEKNSIEKPLTHNVSSLQTGKSTKNSCLPIAVFLLSLLVIFLIVVIIILLNLNP